MLRHTTVLLSALTVLLVVFIIIYPDKAFQSSLQGLSIWWKVVFPALLPFLVVSELLIGFGVIHALAVLLEPLMRLLFRLPGAAGWALAIGVAAGYPAGAQAVGRLKQEKLVSLHEAERLLAVSHVGSPVLIISVVGVGFLHNAALGALLAVVHYASAFAAGWCLRFWPVSRKGTAPLDFNHAAPFPPRMLKTHRLRIVNRSLEAMRQAYLRDGRSFGKLLGDAVLSSVQALMVVGGYIMMFSVVIKVMALSRLTSVLENLIATAVPLGFSNDMIHSLIDGLIEVHLGTYGISQTASDALVWKTALLGAVLAWSGLSYHIQAKSLLQSSGVRYLPFLVSRILHAAFAFALTFLLWHPLNRWLDAGKPSSLTMGQTAENISSFDDWNGWSLWGHTLTWMMWMLVFGVCISLFLHRTHSWLKKS